MGKRVNIICVGKVKEDYIKEGIADYAARLKRFCDFSVTELADYPDGAAGTEKESAAILTKMSGAYNILADINGELVTSEQLASVMEKAYSDGYSTVNFIIGGSNGVDGRVKAAADRAVSFGRVTYPHRLMRLILTEQIYRAFTITANSPYHK